MVIASILQEDTTNGADDGLSAVERYCQELESTASWGGQLELSVLAQVLKRPIKVYAAGLPTVTLGDEFEVQGPPLQTAELQHACCIHVVAGHLVFWSLITHNICKPNEAGIMQAFEREGQESPTFGQICPSIITTTITATTTTMQNYKRSIRLNNVAHLAVRQTE
eukprot:1139738-Pelagomonas_calceolata.AAC.2